MKILLVDDDDLLIQQLTADLLAQNYVVDTTTNGLSGWEYATANPYDLIVLDINLPGLDGVSLCQRLRQVGYSGAILLLTGRSSSSDKVMGLNAGADDYLVKPYTLAELTARLRALLRRPTLVSDPVLRWGDLQLDPNAGLVTVAGRGVVLSPKEYGLLELFLRNRDRIFSNTVLLERLWSIDESPGEETIRTHIKRLRRKLKQAGANDLIENVYGMGYRLKPDIAADSGPDPDPCPDQSGAPAAAAPTVTADQAAAARAAAIAALERFRPTIDERMAALHHAVTALDNHQLSPEVQTAALGAAHKLAGTLGLFGYGAGTTLARRLEDWLQQPNLAQSKTFCGLVTQLEQLLRSPPPLDAAAPGHPPGAPQPALQPAPQPAIVPLPPTQGDRVRVVAVDDDPMILAQLQTLLTPWGVDVAVLQDPCQTLATLTANPPDLLLLDLDMPLLHGLDLCHQLRQSDRWQTLPIVCLTACRDAATLYRLYQAGADDYLPKPVIEPELVSRIFHRVERGRLLQTLAGTDPRTGLANRQKATIELELLLSLAQRQQQPVTVVVVQLRPSPPVPEDCSAQHGLDKGDETALMATLGQGLLGLGGQAEVTSCWGPREFLLSLWGTDGAGAQTWLRRTLAPQLVEPLRSYSLALGTMALGIGALGTIDLVLGAATFPADGQTLQSLYNQASGRAAPCNDWLSLP
ncbi:response regulator [Nodosilinea sp. E11]|uniref:response regulator n=1 Tax=Nodosilinea sp. E11 TaxID=3037479 RepID=UPI0029344B4C|nr:response regulator [Nodosilinea sp. E11]WOD40187.1 response regulator [Nodosilinea sp. E11]